MLIVHVYVLLLLSCFVHNIIPISYLFTGLTAAGMRPNVPNIQPADHGVAMATGMQGTPFNPQNVSCKNLTKLLHKEKQYVIFFFYKVLTFIWTVYLRTNGALID